MERLLWGLIKHTDFIYKCLSNGRLEDYYILEKDWGLGKSDFLCFFLAWVTRWATWGYWPHSGMDSIWFNTNSLGIKAEIALIFLTRICIKPEDEQINTWCLFKMESKGLDAYWYYPSIPKHSDRVENTFQKAHSWISLLPTDVGWHSLHQTGG